MDQDKLNQQSNYWEANFSEKPMMFGLTSSTAALSALERFEKENIKEMGGRDWTNPNINPKRIKIRENILTIYFFFFYFFKFKK